MEILYWILIFLGFYTYIGYPILLFIISSVFKNEIKRSDKCEPTISLIINAYNEEKEIAKKIENTLELDYPKDKLEIIVASDGSTDQTDEIVKRYEDKGIILFRVEGRKGKTEAQNQAAARTEGEILFFSDATSIYPKNVLKMIIRNFNDPKVGGVGGRYIYRASSTSTTGSGIKKFWNYETLIRQFQSKIFSITGASGLMYALRKELYIPIDASIISDMVTPMVIVKQGYRFIFEPEAYTYEDATSSTKEEFKMRIRVITRGMFGMIYMKSLLNPFKFPWIAFQLFSHKVLRWLIPNFLILLFISNLFIIDLSNFYLFSLLAQVCFYLLSILGFLFNKLNIKIKYLNIFPYFVTINYAAFICVFKVLFGKKIVTWEPLRK